MLITLFGGVNVNKFVDNLLKLIPIDLFNPNKRSSFTGQNNFYMKQKMKHTLLKGEGANQHTLYGDFTITEKEDFTEVMVKEKSNLQHEEPNGKFAEHNTLIIDKGNWVMGKQVEYNPFENSVSRVWD